MHYCHFLQCARIKIDSEKDLKKSLDSKIAKVGNGWVSGKCGAEEKIQGC